jgi:hypothetical protein
MKAKLSQNRQEMESLKGSTDAQLEKTVGNPANEPRNTRAAYASSKGARGCHKSNLRPRH